MIKSGFSIISFLIVVSIIFGGFIFTQKAQIWGDKKVDVISRNGQSSTSQVAAEFNKIYFDIKQKYQSKDYTALYNSYLRK